MTALFKCDECGTEIKKAVALSSLKIRSKKYWVAIMAHSKQDIMAPDLCAACIKKILNENKWEWD